VIENVTASTSGRTPDLLPDSRCKKVFTSKGVVFRVGVPWIPIYCASCHCDGGFVPEENCTFAFYLCEPCFERYGAIAGTYAMPDEVFWEKLREAQQKYGKWLEPDELALALENDRGLQLLKQEADKALRRGSY
jgi:hypothetical protein